MSSYKDTFANLLVKTHFTEEKGEDREYDYEGDMAKSQLKSIITNAQRLHDSLEDDTNLPEWVQLKITLAEDYVVTAANYMEGELDEEVETVDEAAKKAKRWSRAEWRMGTESDVDKNNLKIYKKLSATDPEKAAKFHASLMKMRKLKEESAKVTMSAKYVKYKKPKQVAEDFEQIDEFTKSQTTMAHTIGKEFKKKGVGQNPYAVASAMVRDKPAAAKKAYRTILAKEETGLDEEIRYFSGVTVSGKPWKFSPPPEPKMLSPEFVKDRVPTLTDKEAHEVSIVAKDQYNDVDKKFAEMSEGKEGTVPRTPKEKALAAKAHPKDKITHKDVLVARGVKLGEEELREKVRGKIFGGKTLTKKPADPVVFHPMVKGKKAKSDDPVK